MKFSLLLTLLAIASAPSALGQWTSDPAVNQLISGAPSDQNQVKIAPSPDGGFWVSWLDGIGTGWDVRLQKLDARGQEAFPSGGLLVADRGFSSTQDYGLSVATNGDALLAFRDDRSGAVEISAARVDGGGGFAWGPSGVQLTQGAGFVAAPKIAQGSDATSDRVFVAWTENNSVRAQALDAAGQASWTSATTLAPSGGAYLLADMQGVGDDAILSMVFQTGGFTSPRRLVAQRLDGLGVEQWGAQPVPVFSGGSLQVGSFPRFSMGGGDAVFAWYTSSPSLQCYVQRLDGAGVARWPGNGVPVATGSGVGRTNPRAVFDGESGDVMVAW